MKKICPKCKYYFVSEYKPEYGGCPIGCTNTKATSFSGNKCFVPKDKNKKEKKEE